MREQARLRRWLVQALRYYRQLGFFPRQTATSDEELADQLLAYQQEASEPFQADRPYSDLLLLRYDSQRVLFEDLSQRIRWGKNRYGSVLEALAHISRGSFRPRNLVEDWAGPLGPVHLEFEQDGRHYQVVAESPDQRFDMMVLVQLNLALYDSPYRFEVIDPENGSVFIVALTADERARMEKERKLPFYVLDLARLIEPLGNLVPGRPQPGPETCVRFQGTLNEFADRALGRLDLSLNGQDVTGTFRYFGEDHSERFEFLGRWSPAEGILGGTFKGSIQVTGEGRFHPYLGDWVGRLSPGLQVACGTWRGWLAEDGLEEGPEDPSLIYLGQWGVLDEDLLNSDDPYLERLQDWLEQVWEARNPEDYPLWVSPGLFPDEDE